MGYPTNCFQERTWKAQQCLPGLKLPWLRSNRVRFVVPTSSGLAQLREPGRSESDFGVWTWGDTKWKIMTHHFFKKNIAIHYEHGGIPLGYHGGIPWGYHIFRKKTARDPPSWSCFDALFGWPNGECFTTSRNKNTLEPQIWYRRWYPRGFATNVWENMDDINRDMRDTVWDTGW